MPTQTYSDAEAAQIIRGSAARSDIEWLHRHLRGESEPQLPGFKVGRKWRMTEGDIAEAIELLRPRRVSTAGDSSMQTSLTRTSRRRLGRS